MKFAILSNSSISNIILADEAPPFPNVVRIDNISPEPSIGYSYINDTFTPPISEVVTNELPPHVSVGAFKDRMGMDALAIAVSTHPVCVALREMLYDRKYVDLTRPDVATFLDMLIANNEPSANALFPGSGPMTQLKKEAILDLNIDIGERP